MTTGEGHFAKDRLLCDYRIDEHDTCHNQTKKVNESRQTTKLSLCEIVLLSMDSPRGKDLRETLEQR